MSTPRGLRAILLVAVLAAGLGVLLLVPNSHNSGDQGRLSALPSAQALDPNDGGVAPLPREPQRVRPLDLDTGVAVRILHADGQPAAGAQLTVAHTGERREPDARTWTADALGSLVLPIATLQAERWTAEGSGPTPARARLTGDDARRRAEEPGGLTIRLVESRVIHGLARWTNGQPAGDVRVLAWDRTRPPALSQVTAALADASVSTRELLIGVADGSGRFELEGAEAGLTYFVTCGAPGRVGNWAIVDMASPRPALAELTVRAHYGALVQRVDHLGAPMLRPQARFGSEYVMRLTQGHADPYSPEPVHQALLGIATAGWQPETSGTLISLTTDHDGKRVGPLLFEAHQPGFESQRITFAVPRTTTGLKVVTLFMQPNHVATGRLYVQLVGNRASPGDSVYSGNRRATLHLRDLASNKTTRCTIDDLGDELISIDAVPLGSYTASLVTPFGLARLEPISGPHVDVGAKPTTVTFDARQLGSLEIELAPEVARLLPTRAMFNISSPDAGLGTWPAFQQPPYTIDFIAPGNYTVTLYALDEPDATGVRVANAAVKQGKTTQVVLSNTSSREAAFAIEGMRR